MMPAEIPEPIRAAAGLAVTVLGQARQLPANITGLPVRVAGLAMQAALRLQQSYAGLVVRGDELLTQVRRPGDQDAPWATFDDEVVDIAADVSEGMGTDVPAVDDPDGRVSPRTPSFAVQAGSESELPPLPGTTRTRPPHTPSGASGMGQAPSAFDLARDPAADASSGATTPPGEPGTLAPHRRPETPPPAPGSGNGKPSASLAPVPGYDALTLAQLRARLRTFDGATLTSLIDYERAQRSRVAYLSMLENRLNRTRQQG